jgi:hypothetical protein
MDSLPYVIGNFPFAPTMVRAIIVISDFFILTLDFTKT